MKSGSKSPSEALIETVADLEFFPDLFPPMFSPTQIALIILGG